MVQPSVVQLDRPGSGSCLHKFPVTLVGFSELWWSYFKKENDGDNDHLTDLQRALSSGLGRKNAPFIDRFRISPRATEPILKTHS